MIWPATVSAEARDKLAHYAQAVAGAPRHLHLTSEKDHERFLERHIGDALALLPIVDPGLGGTSPLVLDVGTGNGIPGLAWAIARPHWRVSVLDSDAKKCGFIESFCNSESIGNVRLITGRAEELAHTPGERESYQVVVARALAKLRVAIELAGAFVREGGRLIVSHGTSAVAELPRAETAAVTMGFRFPPEPSSDPNGMDLVFKKVSPTPGHYPRRVGIPAKRPL